MLANWITLSRFPLLPIALLLLGRPTASARLLGAGLLFVGLMLDTVDGMVARKRGQSSLFGSVLDIAADRAYELVLWIWFTHLGMISILIPLLVIVRTTVTDAFRSIGVGQGVSPFAQHRTALGRFLVGSTFMRTGYSIAKTVTFCGLSLVLALRAYPAATAPWSLITTLEELCVGLAWVALGFCLLRGLPVVIHSFRYQWGDASG
jgi:CDP-diacylglycerol--glycerol-3-phosphate 3-phosphatidyltransferase